jgi:alpha-1,3-rhamnosyl/mannosyltransferase
MPEPTLDNAADAASVAPHRRVIAYDLRYADDHFTGIGRHAYCLLEALLEQPGPEHYVVLWNSALRSRFDLDTIRAHPRVTWVDKPYRPLAPVGLVQVGAWLRGLKPRVYFSPFYMLPVAAGCPCVLTVHDVFPLRLTSIVPLWKRLVFGALIRRAGQAAAIFTSSDFSRREIATLAHVDPARMRVVRLGVPPARRSITPRRPAALPEGPFALTLGLNYPYKNLETLASVWKRLGPDAPLRLVAAGREHREYPGLGELARRHGVDAIALGHVAEDELEWLFANATMMLFPTTYEGFGFPLVEAFARGLPVVASGIPPLRELDGGAARMLDPHDVDAWAAAVRELAADAGARERMRRAGRERAAQLTYAETARHALGGLREVCGARAEAIAA